MVLDGVDGEACNGEDNEEHDDDDGDGDVALDHLGWRGPRSGRGVMGRLLSSVVGLTMIIEGDGKHNIRVNSDECVDRREERSPNPINRSGDSQIDLVCRVRWH